MRFLRRIFTIKEVPSVNWSSDFPLNTKPRFYTVIMLVTGLFFFGLGEAIIIGSGSGVSPWTVLALSILSIVLEVDNYNLAMFWIGSRVLYYFTYMFGILYLRTLVWGVSIVCLVMMAISLI